MNADKQHSHLPVVVIGAGPVGLAAAAQLVRRNLDVVILERGSHVGHAISQWGHVRVFTPWKYIVDDSAQQLLEEVGWVAPAADEMPTGHEIVDQYLQSLAETPSLADKIRYQTLVEHIAKQGLSKISGSGRAQASFQVDYKNGDGSAGTLLARAVIDASGTWFSPNPIGTHGVAVPGEKNNQKHISYGIPDIRGSQRSHFAGRKTLVLGSGHSAINVVLDLVALKSEAPQTEIVWGNRTRNTAKIAGGGDSDELPARGALGSAAAEALSAGDVQLLAPFAVQETTEVPGGVEVRANHAGQEVQLHVDHIVVATGFRPDLDMLRELRLDMDGIVEAPTKLAPMIDPNEHSCGTVEPHGVTELSHPDAGFYVVGMKSYGRAPTFLMMTGYEQVRSIADELAGNHDAARKVALTLPETGVCSVPTDLAAPSGGCCDSSGSAASKAPDVEVSTTASVVGESARGSCCG